MKQGGVPGSSTTLQVAKEVLLMIDPLGPLALFRDLSLLE